MNTQKAIGFGLIGGGALIGLLTGSWLMIGLTGGDLSAGGALLGLALAAVFVILPMIGGGIYFLNSGSRTADNERNADAMRRVMDSVQVRGQVRMSELAIDLGLDINEVQDLVYQLAGLGVLKGYINWEDGVLYSEQAAGLSALQQCKKCGGSISLVGQGVIKCQFCGTEYFL